MKRNAIQGEQTPNVNKRPRAVLTDDEEESENCVMKIAARLEPLDDAIGELSGAPAPKVPKVPKVPTSVQPLTLTKRPVTELPAMTISARDANRCSSEAVDLYLRDNMTNEYATPEGQIRLIDRFLNDESRSVREHYARLAEIEGATVAALSAEEGPSTAPAPAPVPTTTTASPRRVLKSGVREPIKYEMTLARDTAETRAGNAEALRRALQNETSTSTAHDNGGEKRKSGPNLYGKSARDIQTIIDAEITATLEEIFGVGVSAADLTVERYVELKEDIARLEDQLAKRKRVFRSVRRRILLRELEVLEREESEENVS